jgi:hypothetical protein
VSTGDPTFYENIHGLPFFRRRSAAIRIAEQGLSDADWEIVTNLAVKHGVAPDDVARIVEDECREIKIEFDDEMKRDARE